MVTSDRTRAAYMALWNGCTSGVAWGCMHTCTSGARTWYLGEYIGYVMAIRPCSSAHIIGVIMPFPEFVPLVVPAQVVLRNSPPGQASPNAVFSPNDHLYTSWLPVPRLDGPVVCPRACL